MNTDSSRTWFITGISRGLGRALATRVLAEGDTVIGTTRDGRCDIPPHERLHLLALDLADPASVGPTIEIAFTQYRWIDVIVNNAGYGLLGSIEEATDDEVHHLFEVNFHSPRRLIQAALPFLRVQGSGHIVNITSIAAIDPSAGSGYYAATKMALEGISRSLAKEVAHLGIGVMLVEPGAFRTDFLSRHSIRASRNEIEAYTESAGSALAYLDSIAGQQIGDPERAAEAIIGAVQSKHPPLHLVLGSDAYGRARGVLETFSNELEAWKTVTTSTDFPAEIV